MPAHFMILSEYQEFSSPLDVLKEFDRFYNVI